MKILEINEKEIIFDNGTKLSYYHSQDCCEWVYADFKSLKSESGLMDHEFKEEIELEGVKDAGFRIEGFFIPCYNKQNGYYSSDLELIINYPNKTEKKIDISDFVEDHID